MELVQLVVRRISRRLLQASLDDMLNTFNTLQMKINFFNESHRLWGEVALVSA